MTLQRDRTPETRLHEGTATGWRRGTAWLTGIVGAIALFLGVFITYAGEDQYVGIGGDWSWRVGDITSAWAYGLVIGGGVLLLATLVLAWQEWRSHR